MFNWISKIIISVAVFLGISSPTVLQTPLPTQQTISTTPLSVVSPTPTPKKISPATPQPAASPTKTSIPAKLPSTVSSTENPIQPTTSKKSSNFVLHNIGINIEDIVFTGSIGDHYYNKAFMEFGTELTGPSGTDIMPHPTYILPLGTKVFSPVNGQIETVRQQPEYNDYEALIVPDGFSDWRVSFDHITNLSVKKGDNVKIGDIIAEVAPSRSSAVPSGFGLVELQVWTEKSSLWNPGPGLSTCPFLILDESVKNDMAQKITKLANDWEKLLGKDVYKQDKWVFPGCLFEKATS